MLTKAEVQKILDFQQALEQERKQWEPLWRDCATYIDPNADDFGAETERRQGGKKGEKVFDNTAIMARDRLAAAHESMLTPRNAKWHGLKSSIAELNEDEEVKEYFEAVTHRVFAARYSPKANFSAQIGAYYQCLDTFGTGGCFIDENVGSGLRYKALHLGELYISEDFQGRVNSVHRKFTLTAKQALEMMKAGKFESLPDDIIRAANDPARKLERAWYLHCVYPSENQYQPDRNSWPIESHYICVDHQFACAEGGYRTMPYAVGRYITGPRETYGRAPGMTVLRDIQMLSEMNKTAVREAQRLADPPMFLSGNQGANPFSMRPGAMNYGMMSPDGKPLAQALAAGADLSALLELIQDRRQSVNDAFLVTLFQILLDKPPNMTATEALLRAQEKGVLLTPTMGRQQSEFLGPMIEREIDILTEAGQFDDLPMPDILREAQGGVEIVYDAPLNRLQRTDEAVGILRTVEALAEPAKVDPTVYDVFQWDKVARTMADANGAPASVLNSLEEMAALKEARKASEQMQQAAVLGPAIGKTIKDISQAQAIAGSSPVPIPMVQPA